MLWPSLSSVTPLLRLLLAKLIVGLSCGTDFLILGLRVGVFGGALWEVLFMVAVSPGTRSVAL